MAHRVIETWIAAHNFTKNQPRQVSFTKGTVIKIHNKLDSGWWQGTLPNGEVRWWSCMHLAHNGHRPVGSLANFSKKSKKRPHRAQAQRSLLQPPAPPELARHHLHNKRPTRIRMLLSLLQLNQLRQRQGKQQSRPQCHSRPNLYQRCTWQNTPSRETRLDSCHLPRVISSTSSPNETTAGGKQISTTRTAEKSLLLVGFQVVI